MSKVEIIENQVIKTYVTNLQRDKEVLMSTVLSKNDMSAKVLEINNREIVLSLVDGEVLFEKYNKYISGIISLEEITSIFDGVLNWLHKFNEICLYEFKTYVKLTDFHYRNFIIKDGITVGIDFEEYDEGVAIDNYSSLLGWLKLYDFNSCDKIDALYQYLYAKISQQFCEDNVEELAKSTVDEILYRRKVKSKLKKSTGVLIGGGKSRRMNYRAKASLTLKKYEFNEIIVNELTVFDNILISANDENLYSKVDCTIIRDEIQDIGPIGGIYSVMKKVDTEFIFVTPCDTPGVSYNIIAKLFELVSDDVDMVVAKINGRINPLMAVYRVSLLQYVEEIIKKENYCLMAILDTARVKYVEIADCLKFKTVNVNDENDYKELIEEIKDKNTFNTLI